MSRALALAVICAACAPNASAQPFAAADFVADFEAICLKTNGDRAKILAAAIERGWPADEPPNYPTAPGQDRAVRLRGTGLAMTGVFSEQRRRDLDGVSAVERTCTMMASLDKPATAVEFASRQMAGVTSGSSRGLGGMWSYVQTEAGFRSIRDRADAADAIRSGRYRILMVNGPEPNDPEGSTALSFKVISQN